MQKWNDKFIPHNIRVPRIEKTGFKTKNPPRKAVFEAENVKFFGGFAQIINLFTEIKFC